MTGNKLTEVKSLILQKLNIRQEYEALGVKFTGPANVRGYASCLSPYKVEQHASCGVCLTDPAHLGQFTCFNSGAPSWSKTFFYFAADFLPGAGGDSRKAIKFYADKVGVEFHDGKREIDRQYDYCDADGKMVYQVIRYKGRKNFMPRRPDPLHPSRWIYDLPENMRLPYGLNKIVAAETVYIVEGEKDCQTLEALGLCASTNPFGAGKWVESYNQHFTRKHIIILYDNDEPGKAHAQLVARHLQPIAASVRIVDLPGCENKEDVTDWLSKGHTLEELQQLVDAAEIGTAGSEDSFSEELIKQYGEPYYLNQYGEVVKINESFWAGKNHLENIQLYEPDERAFYRYVPAKGLYEIVTQDSIKLEISNSLLDASRKSGARSLEKQRTNSNLSNTVAHLRGIAQKKNAFHKTSNFVHLENGVIVFNDDRSEADFCEFSPEFFSRNRCPIPFNQDATCERFLNELIYPAVSPDDAILLQKYFGQCLLARNLTQQILILDGEAARGKTTLVKILQGIIGLENVCELRTRQLNERFEIYRYLKKTLLVGSDVPGDFLNEKGAHVLKALVGGDWLDAEQKGGTGNFPLQGNFGVLITSNSRLHVRLDGDSDAWKRRLLIVRFAGPKPVKRIPDFDKILIRDEGSGILNWCLHGLRMLLDDIGTHGEIKLTSNQAGIVDALLSESDSIRHFLMDCVQKSEQDDLSTTEIIEKYAEYCPRMGWTAQPITVIQRELEGLMLELFGTAKAHGIQRDGKNHRGFRHVNFKNAGV